MSGERGRILRLRAGAADMGGDPPGRGLAAALGVHLEALDYEAVALEPTAFGWRIEATPPGAQAPAAVEIGQGEGGLPTVRICAGGGDALFGAEAAAAMADAHAQVVRAFVEGRAGVSILDESDV